MESLKVADPIMLGYGAGIIPGRFGANRSIRIDIIPVDFVANACLVAAAHPPETACACSTSARACATRSRSATSPS